MTGKNLVNLEYADDIVLLFGEFQQAQPAMDKLTEVIPSLGMHLAPSKCKVMLQEVRGLNISLTLQRWLYIYKKLCQH